MGESSTSNPGLDNEPLTAAQPALQERDRPLPPARPAETGGTGSLHQASTKPAETLHGPSNGITRGLPATGLSAAESFESHLRLRAREALENSTKQFHLRIQADGLGSMRWDVRLEPGKIAAQALVDTTRLQELVQGQQDTLIQRLQALGLEVESFEVLVDSGSAEERFHGRQAPESGDDPGTGISQSRPARSPNRPSRNADRGLDLFV